MDQSKRKGGRPPARQRKAGERVPLGLRVTLPLKEKLDQAARDSGRSQSQEAELRLEQSFELQSLLSDAMSLAYGRQETAILLTLARVFVSAGRIGGVMSTGKFEAMENWVPDPTACAAARQAALAVLEAYQPAGPINQLIADSGRDSALITLAAIRDPAWGDQFPDQHRNRELERFAAQIRDLAGDDLVSRIPTEGATK